MADILDTVLLLALPASGKSEVRKYLAQLPADVCARDFHMGSTVQLDDFPYVHMMRQTDEALRALGNSGVFFQATDKPFADARDWGTLIELINEDYADLVAKRQIQVPSAGAWLLDRFDAARGKVGAPLLRELLDETTRKKVAAAIEAEAGALLKDKVANYPDSLAGKTLVIEFARGGKDGSSMPLPAPFGYAYSLGRLSSDILSKAAVLYIWVTPEESRRKNQARTDPNDPGSILHHGVPIDVMLGDYGCDDMAYLLETSDAPNSITIDAGGKSVRLPVGRFDNRVDKTSFVRGDASSWSKADVEALHQGLKHACDQLAAARR